MKTCATTLAAEMTANEHELLIDSLGALDSQDHCLEIGTAAGGTLCAMMSAFADYRRPKFVVVDPLKYFPNQLETIQRNLAGHQLDAADVDFREASSAVAFPQAVRKGDRFAFILVDGCHRIGSVMLDLKWTRLLNPGGLICFHDYAPKFPGVTLCVDRLLKRHKNYLLEDQADSLIVIRKTGVSSFPEVDLADQLFATFCSFKHRLSRKLARWQRPRSTCAAVN